MPRRVEVGFRDPVPRQIADPANGERVVRCRSCGMPNSASPIEGVWRGAVVRFPVCEVCVLPFIVRDPLEAA